ncbi:TPA: SUKH-3 domain-containing protein [Burkholderia stabilis]|nr:SUKH-3 domain-containing protein [Burkholderia stabilis]HDR9648254.1 SUKH-3 domain-containing protein [Burkholderia stabilis]HDR9655776.1 SUKH-3 domain-containing protein [Burkholderia stabilis]HDR9679101.1 SUKH-3 domain-containing protein [Burkholderia stabilis]
MVVIPSSVKSLFVDAGWRGDNGRRASSGDGEHPGDAILREFGGLIVGADLPDSSGQTCARMGLAFHALARKDRQIDAWEQALGTTMIGFAEDDLGYAEFYVDAQGRVFSTNCVVDGVYLCGFTFGEAVERTLLGRVSIPLLLDDRATIAYYGEVLTIDDPRVMTVDRLLART